jgi:hypothetical protein
MKREAESQFLEFCVRQREAFSPQDWLSFAALPKDELAAAALFLGGVDWFGHQRELLAVASDLHGVGMEQFSDLVMRTDFSCSRFSSMLKARLRHEHANS